MAWKIIRMCGHELARESLVRWLQEGRECDIKMLACFSCTRVWMVDSRQGEDWRWTCRYLWQLSQSLKTTAKNTIQNWSCHVPTIKSIHIILHFTLVSVATGGYYILTGSCRYCTFCSIYPRSCKMMFPIRYLVYKCKLLYMFTNNIACL